jgi:CPA1 family monovalent cation:H+ antiporter
VWNVIVFLINCLVFVLIGIQLPVAVAGLASDHTLSELAGYALVLTVVAMVVRMAWVFPGTYVPRWLNRRFGRFEAYPPWQQVTVVGWCGMRGIVSLAAALALPSTTPSGTAFPGQDLIIFLTFVVILLTLVVPGITLAPLIRRLKVGGDWDAHEELRVAREGTARAALQAIHHLEQHGDITAAAAAHLREDYQSRLARTLPHGLLYAPSADPLIRGRRAALAAERRELIRLWREDKIGDEVLHEIERELDLEAARLGH